MSLVLLFVISLQNGWALPQTLYIPVTKKDLNPRHLGHLLINDTYKVAFCPIEKVMSTQFRQLFDRVGGDPLWFEHPYHKMRMKPFENKTIAEVEEIMHDPTWIKAVFFRDPAKRLLSSYLHLVKSPESIKRYKTMLYQRNRSTTWTDFWQSALSPKGVRNIHWDPQTNFCGLEKFWPLYNFVGNYELLQEHGREFATRTKLSQFMDHGWAVTKTMRHPVGRRNPNRTQMYLDAAAKAARESPEEDCMMCKNRAQHKNDYTADPMTKYLRPDVWRYIRRSKVYKNDYSIFEKIKASPFNFTVYDVYSSDRGTGSPQ